jgi:2-phospho-L-lactate guanylyltransferase
VSAIPFRPAGSIGWWVIVPLKDTRIAKSRIEASPDLRRRLTIAMFRDTLNSVLATPTIEGIVVVYGHQRDAEMLEAPGFVTLVEKTSSGINSAITAGGTLARQLSPTCRLAVLPGDLPLLRSDELTVALADAAHHARAFVADADGTGTTLLTALAPHELTPRYGSQSRFAHAATGAVELADRALISLRRDIDNIQTLVGANRSALGPHTVRLLHDFAPNRFPAFSP